MDNILMDPEDAFYFHFYKTPDWTNEKLENLIVYCIINTQMPYKKVCEVYNALYEKGVVTRRDLSIMPLSYIQDILKEYGCRFPNNKGKYIKEFGGNLIDLQAVTREELVKGIKGVGMKLASMYLNWARGTQYAILDVHIIRYLQEQEVYTGKYLQDEEAFTKLAEQNNMTVADFDEMIWEERRVGAQ